MKTKRNALAGGMMAFIFIAYCSSEPIHISKNAKQSENQGYAQSAEASTDNVSSGSLLVCCDIGPGYNENERYYLMLPEMICKQNGVISLGSCGEEFETNTITNTDEENVSPCSQYDVNESDDTLLPSSFDISHCQRLSDEGNSICDGYETAVWVCTIKVIQKDEIYCTYWKREGCGSGQRCESTTGICISRDPENEYP